MRKSCYVLMLFLLMALVSNAFGAALYNEWRGTTTNWNTPTNWNFGYVPTIWRDANNIRAGFKGNVVVTAWPIISGTTIPVAEAYNITLGGSTGGSLRIDSGGVLNVGQYIAMGVTSTESGTFNINGGTITTGTISTNAHLIIGQAGTGTAYMNGGTIALAATGNLRIADTATAKGNLYLNAGTIYANDLLMPFALAGSLNISGGTLILNGDDTIAVGLLVTAGKIVTSLEGGTIQVSYSSGTTKTTVSAIPEPATICLLGLGALSLIRRKK